MQWRKCRPQDRFGQSRGWHTRRAVVTGIAEVTDCMSARQRFYIPDRFKHLTDAESGSGRVLEALDCVQLQQTCGP